MERLKTITKIKEWKYTLYLDEKFLGVLRAHTRLSSSQIKDKIIKLGIVPSGSTMWMDTFGNAILFAYSDETLSIISCGENGRIGGGDDLVVSFMLPKQNGK